MKKNTGRVLITGVAGFIGRHAARYFSQAGWEVFGIDSASAENAPLPCLEAYVSLWLPSRQLLELICAWKPEVLIHCAGRASVEMSIKQPEADFHGNTVITFEVLEALRRHAPNCRFINLSSAAIYGNPDKLPISETHPPAPISPYGFHKWQTDILCQEYATAFGLHTASLRIFSAYGPGLRRQVMWDICNKAITLGRLQLHGSGEESRDFIHVQDIARALGTLATAPSLLGQSYNLGTGREVTIRELANLILTNLAFDFEPEFDGQLGGGIPRNWCADISRLQVLGYSPEITLEQGLTQFTSWCRSELGRI